MSTQQTVITYVIRRALQHLVDLLELILIGSFAGFTIFLGLPIVLLGISDRVRGFLNAFAVGILMFLIVDVFGHAWDTTTVAA